MAESSVSGPNNDTAPASVLKNLTVAGRTQDPALKIPGMPPNMGEFAIPQIVTFQSIAASVARVHRIWDEAMKASMDNARFMINDLVVSECIEQRLRSCALLNWHLEVDNPRDTVQKELAENLTKIIENIPYFVKFRESLLEAIWLGKSAVQWRYGCDSIYGVKPAPNRFSSFTIPEWLPIHGDKLVFRYDDGSKRWDPHQIGIRVGAGYGLGDTFRQKALGLDQRGADVTRKIETTDYGLAYFLEPYEHQNLAIHKHLIRDGEYEDVLSTGKIHGIGVRSRIYWAWYQKQECLAFMMEFLERSALGLEIWYYPWGNPDAEAKTRKAAQERIGQGRNIVLMPRPTDESGASPYGVEKLEPGMAGLQALQDVVQNYFGAQIKRYILGQTLTTEAQATGLGSNLATIHLDTYLQIVKYDAVNLEETLTKQLVDRLKIRNYPHLRSIPVRFKIDTESADAESKLQAIQSAYEMGLKIRSQDVMDLIGIAKPEEDDQALMNPAIEQAKLQTEQTRQQIAMTAMQMEAAKQQQQMAVQAPAQVVTGQEQQQAQAQQPEQQQQQQQPAAQPEQFSASSTLKENNEPELVEKFAAGESEHPEVAKAREDLKKAEAEYQALYDRHVPSLEAGGESGDSSRYKQADREGEIAEGLTRLRGRKDYKRLLLNRQRAQLAMSRMERKHKKKYAAGDSPYHAANRSVPEWEDIAEGPWSSAQEAQSFRENELHPELARASRLHADDNGWRILVPRGLREQIAGGEKKEPTDMHDPAYPKIKVWHNDIQFTVPRHPEALSDAHAKALAEYEVHRRQHEKLEKQLNAEMDRFGDRPDHVTPEQHQRLNRSQEQLSRLRRIVRGEGLLAGGMRYPYLKLVRRNVRIRVASGQTITAPAWVIVNRHGDVVEGFSHGTFTPDTQHVLDLNHKALAATRFAHLFDEPRQIDMSEVPISTYGKTRKKTKDWYDKQQEGEPERYSAMVEADAPSAGEEGNPASPERYSLAEHRERANQAADGTCPACGCRPCACHIFTPQWAEETRGEIDAILV